MDHDAELDAIVAMLSEAGMVEAFTEDDGKPALRLTPGGASTQAAGSRGGSTSAL